MYLKFTKAELAIPAFQIKLTPCINSHRSHLSPCGLVNKYLSITAPCYMPVKVMGDEYTTRVVSPWDSMVTCPPNHCPPACVPTLLLAIVAVNMYTLSNSHHIIVHKVSLSWIQPLSSKYVLDFSLSIFLCFPIFS